VNGTEIRFAREEETGVILGFIRELAAYEKMEDQVTATEELLRETVFRQKHAQVLLALQEGRPVGFALFFHNFSTFLGKPGIYLEDLYVQPAHRGAGVGKALLQRLAQLAREQDCGRLEWSCLNWNAPSIAFYKRMGAVPMEEWTVYRVTGAALERLAAGEAGRSAGQGGEL
jgi:GNAT superfamily N-acetyltransferase